MWKCKQCNEEIEETFDSCWNCGTTREGTPSENSEEFQRLSGEALDGTYKEEISKEDDGGFFAPERKGIEKGILGGIIMMAIAVIWFVVGYAAGYIFYYPPILFLIGVYAFFKGFVTRAKKLRSS